jgi:hypothetical protein
MAINRGFLTTGRAHSFRSVADGCCSARNKPLPERHDRDQTQPLEVARRLDECLFFD